MKDMLEYPKKALTSNTNRILKIDEDDYIYTERLVELKEIVLKRVKKKIVIISNPQLKNLLKHT